MHCVGIIGTGEIGWRMGKLLITGGHAVVGYDIRPAALQRPKQSGFQIAPNIDQLCRQADVVITCVTDGNGLLDVIEGPGGLAESLGAGRPVIDTTSAEPWITRGVAARLEERGIPFLDAPVSGGVPAAEAGRMNFMVGGDPALLARCRPLLEKLGPVITHVGGVGSGHAVKAVNMLALASKMLATAEVAAIGLACGLELEEIIEHFDRSPAASYSTRVHFPRFIVPGNFASGFTFDLMRKDLAIGLGLADRHGVPLLLGKTTGTLYGAAANTGLEGGDNTRIVESIIGRADHCGAALDVNVHLDQLMRLAAIANIIIAAEALSLGTAAGLAPERVIEVLLASSGDSHALSVRLASYLRSEDDHQPVTLEEELRCGNEALSLALSRQVPAFVTAQAMLVHVAAMRRFGRHADRNRVVDLVSAWAGVEDKVLGQRTAGEHRQ